MGIMINENALVLDDNDSIERNKKEKEYLDYINNHIANVRKAFMMYVAPCLKLTNLSKYFSDEDFKKAAVEVYKRLDKHDASKFSDAEFDGYRAYWYPTNREANYDEDYQVKMEERYDECCQHHVRNNPHHGEYWFDKETNSYRDMSLDAILEMLCDWSSFALMFGDSTLDWYENRADEEKSIMSPHTKEIVEDFLYNIFYTPNKEN